MKKEELLKKMEVLENALTKLEDYEIYKGLTEKEKLEVDNVIDSIYKRLEQYELELWKMEVLILW